jgi:hypothetical protein
MAAVLPDRANAHVVTTSGELGVGLLVPGLAARRAVGMAG